MVDVSFLPLFGRCVGVPPQTRRTRRTAIAAAAGATAAAAGGGALQCFDLGGGGGGGGGSLLGLCDVGKDEHDHPNEGDDDPNAVGDDPKVKVKEVEGVVRGEARLDPHRLHVLAPGSM